jgi:uncharacterized protein (DUF1697 family)
VAGLEHWHAERERGSSGHLPGTFAGRYPSYDDVMTSYAILMRGVNVGGKNKVPMSELRRVLEEQGFSNVSTYIQSGNVLLRSDLDSEALTENIERCLPRTFKLDSSIVNVLALTCGQMQAVIDNKPEGFGEQPEKYHSDAIFLMGIDAAEALPVFSPREGVDTVWPGDGVIYSQRLSALRTKSRLNKIMASPLYKSMTIRSWSTTLKLSDMLKDMDAGQEVQT